MILETDIKCDNWFAGHGGRMEVSRGSVSYARAHEGWSKWSDGTRCDPGRKGKTSKRSHFETVSKAAI